MWTRTCASHCLRGQKEGKCSLRCGVHSHRKKNGEKSQKTALALEGTSAPENDRLRPNIVRQVGTYGVALVAKAHNKPVYVAAESYKVCMREQDLCMIPRLPLRTWTLPYTLHALKNKPARFCA